MKPVYLLIAFAIVGLVIGLYFGLRSKDGFKYVGASCKSKDGTMSGKCIDVNKSNCDYGTLVTSQCSGPKNIKCCLNMSGPTASEGAGSQQFGESLSWNDKPLPACPREEPIYHAILRGINAPITGNNMAFMLAWHQAEGGHATYNPFNTTRSWPGATDYNSVHVRNYPTPSDGVQATVKTLLSGHPVQTPPKTGYYSKIVTSLQNSADPLETAAALKASPWGTGGLVEKILKSGKVRCIAISGDASRDPVRSLYSGQAVPTPPQQSENSSSQPPVGQPEQTLIPSDKFIILNGANVPVQSDYPVIPFTASSAMSFYTVKHGYAPRRRKIQSIVLHDSITDTARSTFNVLKARKLATHFTIDKDGTIYQHLDPKDAAWHVVGWNEYSIGIDIANILEPKYGGGGRPKHKAEPWSPAAGYWDLMPAQVSALKGLLAALTAHYGIPNEPAKVDGKIWYRNKSKTLPFKNSTYRGVIAHGSISLSRWDGNDSILALWGE